MNYFQLPAFFHLDQVELLLLYVFSSLLLQSIEAAGYKDDDKIPKITILILKKWLLETPT